jgi:hypothetical protein
MRPIDLNRACPLFFLSLLDLRAVSLRGVSRSTEFRLQTGLRLIPFFDFSSAFLSSTDFFPGGFSCAL